ncbi:Tip20p Ecym_3368 [Eremothecium cymbalariae DBVPG|uniref:Uncharacterized protein n=1 Tax=Eremothecium cymbalariae (strain CBS 270.75 / DBVPG 7215 / KCTC 17166 / NRRL Y-17582) TaxID=931890 RepID=G8JRT6_ERECY|nr:Hypothetical protein Ecym_3368 [Eremothecium cymbalariae DBVPG\
MLSSIENLFQIDELVRAIEEERDIIAEQLQECTNVQDDLLSDFGTLNEKLASIAQEISSVSSLDDVERLKSTYGNLTILSQIEFTLKSKRELEEQLENAEQIESLLRQLNGLETTEYKQLKDMHDKILTLVESDISMKVINRFNEIVTSHALELSKKFEKDLLEARCDTPQFVYSERVIRDLREQSSYLFKLSQLILPEPKSEQYWNFVCLANNFKIKFIYHFTNPSSESEKQSIENYFKFLDKYLDENLFKYIEYFHDEEVTKSVIHKKFVDHILDPVREKIQATLTKISTSNSPADIKTLVILISQIFITDNALLKNHLYDGVGLVSLIPLEALKVWQNFEVESATSQFEKITSNKSLSTKSSVDFSKLLENMYKYLEPFFNIDYHVLFPIKFQLADQIFIQLPIKYRAFLLSKDVGMNSLSQEQQLENTFLRLHNLLLLYNTLALFCHKVTFIEMKNTINRTTNSNYDSIFDEVLGNYDDALVILRDSIVHRWVKKLSNALRNYFKFNEWHKISAEPEQCSPDLVEALSLMKKITRMLEEYSYPVNILDEIKVTMLENIINFYLNYIVKLNKFSEKGLDQLQFDFESIRETLNLSYDRYLISEEASLLEYFKILELKFSADPIHSEFLKKGYISKKQSDDFQDLRSLLDIRHLDANEIADALYRSI